MGCATEKLYITWICHPVWTRYLRTKENELYVWYFLFLFKGSWKCEVVNSVHRPIYKYLHYYHWSRFTLPFIIHKKMEENGTTHDSKVNEYWIIKWWTQSTVIRPPNGQNSIYFYSVLLSIDRSKTNKIVTSQNLYQIKSVSFYSFQYQQYTL